jgi:hypothetical protein
MNQNLSHIETMSVDYLSVIDFYKRHLELKNGIITTTLYKTSEKNKISSWNINIGLFSYTNNQPVTIIPEYISQNKLENLKVAYWSLSGDINGKKRQTVPKYVYSGSNLEKSNQTNIITQAIKIVRNEYNKKISKGFKTTPTTFDINTIFIENNWRFAPPAFHKIQDNWDKIKYPCYIQPKLDGNRLISVYHPNIENIKFPGLGLYTRNRKIYKSNQFFIKELYVWLKKFPKVYVDCEICIRGHQSFQYISGQVRKLNADIYLNCYIFDIFIPDNLKMTYKERLKKLRRMFIETKFTSIFFLETYTVNNKEELQQYMNKFIEMGEEGAIVRMSTDVYKYSFSTEKRVNSVLKWKLYNDDEWNVVNFTHALGNHQDCLLWVCKTKTGKEFVVNFAEGVFSIEERRKIYKYLKENINYFKQTFLNQELTIKYQSLTNNKIPIRGGALRFRNSNIEEKIRKILNDNKQISINNLFEDFTTKLRYLIKTIKNLSNMMVAQKCQRYF